MTFEKTKLEGVFIINNFNAIDDRGSFVKTFNKNLFNENNIAFKIRESYYSSSKKDVIRGMHFQLPPHDHEKLVYVAIGEIIDVVIDLRKNSLTYKEHISAKLSAENKKSIFIPKGLAHGFKSLINDTITVYNVATEYSNTSDAGISYDSFGFDWEVAVPIVSARDNSLEILNNFNSPF
jgi:dTDP-4-dehydrorhamnose 3,5-epimerase/CDP-3, 6-dideoxy-D-glycero-D-glycero-4-hexulose-5-epimerase